MDEKELTLEELEQVVGGRRTRRANRNLTELTPTNPDPPDTGGPIIGDPEPVPDPPFEL